MKSIDGLKEDIQKRQEKLESLQPSLSSLLKVAPSPTVMTTGRACLDV